MKTFLRVLSIIAGSCLVAGVVFLSVAGANYNSIRDYTSRDTVAFDESVSDIEGITKVYIDIDIASAKLVYEGDIPKLEGRTDQYSDFSIYREGDTLKVVAHEKESIWFDHVNFFPLPDYNYNEIVITLPESWKDSTLDYDINIGLGSIVCDKLVADNLTMQVSMGSIIVKNINAKNLLTQCDMGTINISGSVYTGASVNSNAGTIVLELENTGAVMQYLNANVDAGTIKASGFNTDVLSSSCGMGSAILKGSVQKSCDLSCDMGTLNLTLNDVESNWQADSLSVDMGTLKYAGRNYSGMDNSFNSRTNGDKILTARVGMGTIVVDFK